jgi:hypothetical protein
LILAFKFLHGGLTRTDGFEFLMIAFAMTMRNVREHHSAMSPHATALPFALT